MRSTVLATTLLASSLTVASASFISPIRARNIVDASEISDSYDYVIVGGGTAGLIIAARLSENADTTVLVLEAGHTGDEVADQINIPDETYFNTLTNTEYDFAYVTAQQPNLSDRTIAWPRGKVLGGSSAINAMFYVRPPQVEIDAWHSLVQDQDGADNWTWDSLYNAMLKAETFHTPSAEAVEDGGITYDESVHGTDGPLHSSYSPFQISFNGYWQPTLANAGIERRTDSTGGENWGSVISPSFINPSNWTRSYTRSAYIDPLPPRDNLDILADATVTRITFEGSGDNLRATGVEYASAEGDETRTIGVSREVILAAGVMGSPQLLMLSGIGPEDVLNDVGIDVRKALPGVGQHLQDHLLAAMYWSTENQTAGDLHESGLDTPEFLAVVNAATAYVNITAILGESNKTEIIQNIKDTIDASVSLVPSDSDQVRAGYRAVFAKTIELFETTATPNVEILMSITGAGSIGMQASLQHPMSPGRLYINSTSAFDHPIIDPGYLKHSSDLLILREGIKLVRRLGSTPPLSDYLTGELSPGGDVETDEEWEEWLRNSAWSQFHPRGSCSMLPEEQGGVVNAQLRVYGTTNVRVADGAIFPIDMSTHTQAPTIGVAEIASDLIKAANGVSKAAVSWVLVCAPVVTMLFLV